MSLASSSILSLSESLPSDQHGSGVAKVTDLGGFKTNSNNDFSNTDTELSSSSIRDDTDAAGVRLEERLQLNHLEQMRQLFSMHEPPQVLPTPSLIQHPDLPVKPAKNQRTPGLLTCQEFKDLVVKVLRTHAYDDQLDNLFMKLDVSCDGYVDWTEFCNYMLRQFRENDYMDAKKPLPFHADPRIRHIIHNRQETTTKVLAIDNPLKYVTISKEGAISVFDPNLHFEKHYVIPDSDEGGGANRNARRIRYWVTDAVYMPNCRKIALATTGRDIRFLDVTSSIFFEDFHLYSLPHVPTCLEYVYNDKSPSDEAMLIYGDECGNMNLLYFTKPMQQLFETPFKKDDGVQKIYYPELRQHTAYARHVLLGEIHTSPVKRVLYQADSECILSCSLSPTHSVVICDIERKKKTYVWRLSKGVDCFDYKKSMNALVTGSSDHIVRVWNPYVTSKPVAILQGHHMSIVDVKLHEPLGQVFSLSRDAMLKVWDMKDQVCLQNVTVKFPCSMLGRLPEYGAFAMHLQFSPGRCLLICANDYIAQLKLGAQGPPKSTRPTSHSTQLCCALYNPLFQTVVTGADDSSVGVWDFETGAKSMMFTHAHGNDEITCMAFDSGQRRLFTGARNGTIKIWNIQNGHNLSELAAVDESEVTGILPLADKKLIIAVGWSRIISVYDDSDSDISNLKPDTSWQGTNMHKEDILSIAHLPPYLIATCSFDGEISVWNIENRNLYVKLRKGQQQKMSSELYAAVLGQYLRPLTPALHKPRSSSEPHISLSQQGVRRSSSQLDPLQRGSAGSSRRTGSSRPNSRHRKNHKPLPGLPAPVDKIIFLKARAARKKRNEAALLVSSEAGNLIFWSIHAAFYQQGEFYACENKDESILGMTTNKTDTLLVTGDTQGYVSVWNIENYCTEYREQDKCLYKPEKIFHWQAHDSAIVSVEYIEHECGKFVLTASTDHTSKLFTEHGFLVGVFGQKQLWNLRNKESWQERPPECLDDVINPVTTSNMSHSPTLSELDQDFKDQEDIELQFTAEKIASTEKLLRDSTMLSIPTIERGETLSDLKVPNEKDVNNEDIPTETAIDTDVSYVHPTKLKALTAQPARSDREVIENSFKSRSVTFHYGSKQFAHPITPKEEKPKLSIPSPVPVAKKSLLGSTVDRRLSKITQDRQERREFFEKEAKPTSRFGKICCPYQAINIPDIQDIAIPQDLPLSPRMMNRGLTAGNLKVEDILRSMDSTLGDNDTSDSNTSMLRAGSNATMSLASGSFTDLGQRRSAAGKRLPALNKRRKNSASNSTISGGRNSSLLNGPKRLSPIQS